jgi:phosphoribosylformylglycinamidine cyclo-ligase
VKPILSALKKFELKGMAHITGGGFIENIPRMLPAGLGAELNEKDWEIPPVFKLLSSHGQIDYQEMYNIFNMGIGMVIAVDRENAADLLEHLRQSGETAYEIGVVTSNEGIHIKPQGGRL